MATQRPRPLDLSTLRPWSFLTSHAQVLLVLARDRHLRVERVATEAGVSERTCYRILNDLQNAGYVRRARVGRRNAYEINADLPLRDPVVEDELVRTLLGLVAPDVRSG